MHKKLKKGFTLAEVLLVLTIIGIIAKLTIPSLIINTNNNKFGAGFMKLAGVLDSATRKIIDDEGEETLVNVFSDNANLMSKYSNLMISKKTCTTAQGNCWHSAGVWKALGGAVSNATFTTQPGLQLLDGTYLLFQYDSSTCSNGNYTINAANSQCGAIYADVNGASGPNRVGRDIFVFKISKDGLKPGGSSGDSAFSATDVFCNATDTTSGNNGLGCPFKILKDNKVSY